MSRGELSGSASIAAFDGIYRQAIAALSIFLKDLEPDEARLYRLWLERGYGEFQSWQRKPELEEYLRIASANRFKALQVLSFAYLHLAYDFPRTLAQLFQEQLPLSREQYRRVFVEASSTFIGIAATSCYERATAGVFATLFNVLPGGRFAVDTTCNWLLALRCSSWMAAETLADSDNRTALEERLLQGIQHAAGRAFRHHNPLHWMRSLPFAHELVQESRSIVTPI